jgi:phage I-like protein
MSEKRNVPTRPKGDLRAVSLQVELNPIEKEALPVQVVQILPFGEVQIRDSRENFRVSDISVLTILAHFGSTTVDLAFDYDHGMYFGDNNEAAGWGERMWAMVPPDVYDRIAPFIEQYGDRTALISSEEESDWGIYVFTRWTERAAEKIWAREYRYISPVVFFSFTGEAEYVWNAALVNNPAIDGMDALAASVMPAQRPPVTEEETGEVESSAACHNQPDDGTAGEPISLEETSKEERMDLQTFASFIRPDVDTEVEGFDSEAFMAEVKDEIACLRERAEQSEALAAENEQVKADRDEARETLEATGKENVELREQVESFHAASRESKVDEAIVTGTIAKSQRDWALSNFEAFETLLETLGDEQKLGPPQGEAVKTVETEEELVETGSFSVEAIKAYQAEQGLPTFEAAYIKLRKASQ